MRSDRTRGYPSSLQRLRDLGMTECDCNGAPVPTGGYRCRTNGGGELTCHRCLADGVWVDTGKPCENANECDHCE